MDSKIEKVLKNMFISRPRQLISEFAFDFRELPITIKVKLYREIGRKAIWFTQSHYIRTPGQLDEYITSNNSVDTDDETYALSVAISCILPYYEQAIKEGHRPQESWLVPNPDF